MVVLIGTQEPLNSKDSDAKDGAAISGGAGLEYKGYLFHKKYISETSDRTLTAYA